jgi:DNA-binding GntR family transcriptional regulator
MTSDIGRDTAGADRTDADRLPRPLERPEQTFSSRAVSVLREMVLSGRMRAGERLNEVELAHALQISRGPLREAIQRLRSEGLLTAVSGRGAFVRTFTIDTLRELYEVRIALETHGVRLAARNSDSDGIQQLRQLLADTDQALAGDHAYPQDLDFHQRIMELADNHALLDVATEVHRQIHLARTRSGHVSTRARQALEEHQEVLKHLADGDGERAAEVLATHLRASLQSVLELLDSEGTMPVDAGEGVNGADSSPVRAARR